MNVQIFLVAPTDWPTDRFLAELGTVLAAAPVAALFLPRGDRELAAYKEFARAVVPLAQARECAILVDDAELAWELGADGAHVAGNPARFKPAAATLKPDLIAGAGPADSHDDAMTLGEMGADYVLFGDFGTAPATDHAIADALWWAETFEVPSVLFEPPTGLFDDFPCEFIGLGPSVWAAPQGPAAALTETAAALAPQEEPAA